MKKFGNLFFRPALALVVMMLVVAAAMPTSASAMLALQSDDFNRCTPDPMWTFQGNGVAGAKAEIIGAYSEDSALQLTLPAGQDATFSDSNVLAPRVITEISDTSFAVEIKLDGANLASNTADFVTQGLLFRDASDPGAVEWLRFDFNSRNGVLNVFISYLQTDALGEPETVHVIRGLALLAGGTLAGNAPLYLNVAYDKDNGEWGAYWQRSDDPTDNSYYFEFEEADIRKAVPPDMPISIDFDVDAVAIFVANSGSGLPASIAKVDYFEVEAAPIADEDGIVLTTEVNPAASAGTINQTACVGNQVTLEAVAEAGYEFDNWSGDASGETTTTTVTMTADRNVIANFTQVAVLDLFLYLPPVSK